MINLRSKITQKVLSYFFLHPQSELYLNELARLLKVDRGNLVKKLKELSEDEGILTSHFKGHQHYYALNKKYPFYKEYKGIVTKAFGIESDLKSAFLNVKGVKHLFIFGSYATDKMDTQSDIDILIIGSCPHLLIARQIDKIQRKTKREINVIDFNEKEYQNRVKNKDPFIMDILSHKLIKVI